jgi:maltose O-acetyltransferase
MRFRVWVAYLRARLRRHGARLELDAPHGARVHGLPRVRATTWGPAAPGGDRVLRLRLGHGVRIGSGLVLEVNPGSTNTIELGDHVELGELVHLVVRGGAVRLGARTVVRSFAVLKADGELVTAGDNMLSYGVVVHCAQRVALGARTIVAERSSLVDSDHRAEGDDFYNAPPDIAPVELGDNVLVGANVVVTAGTRIGSDSIVAAGTVTTGREAFPAGSLLAGAPARVVRALAR